MGCQSWQSKKKSALVALNWNLQFTLGKIWSLGHQGSIPGLWGSALLQHFGLLRQKLWPLKDLCHICFHVWNYWFSKTFRMFFGLPCQKAKTKKAKWLKANRKKARWLKANRKMATWQKATCLKGYMLKGYMFERLNAKRLQLSKATHLKGYMTKGYNFQRLHDKRLQFSKAKC